MAQATLDELRARNAELEEYVRAENLRSMSITSMRRLLDDSELRVAELEALHAANDELVGTLQDALAAETTRHYETAKRLEAVTKALRFMIDIGSEYYDMGMGPNGSMALDRARAALATTSGEAL